MPKRLELLQQWLAATCKLSGFDLRPASGDASFRRYFRITLPGDVTRIVMDAPPEKENCEPFVRIARQFARAGLHVPAVLAEDHDQGFLLLEDLGATQYLEVLDDHSVGPLYADAISALLLLQSQCDPATLPPYDETLLRREMALFPDWLLTRHLQLELTSDDLSKLDQVFSLLVANALEQPVVCVHRDYHSRNLMLIPPDHERPNPGVLDFQDAVAGPITYDLVSLLKDCYIAWPREQVVDWVLDYRLRCLDSGLLNDVDEQRFLRWFDLMGVQRHLKAAGIFARLYHRDGKDGYLKDIPRTVGYIQQLKGVYPELDELIVLIDRHW